MLVRRRESLLSALSPSIATAIDDMAKIDGANWLSCESAVDIVVGGQMELVGGQMQDIG